MAKLLFVGGPADGRRFDVASDIASYIVPAQPPINLDEPIAICLRRVIYHRFVLGFGKDGFRFEIMRCDHDTEMEACERLIAGYRP